MLDGRCLDFATTRRVFTRLSMALVTGCLPSMALAQAERRQSAEADRPFELVAFRGAGEKPRAAILVLGGSKGYASASYRLLTSVLNGVGFDVFLIEYLTPSDETAMREAGSASARLDFYAGRLAGWSETVGIAIERLSRGTARPTGLGVIGISLGAMPALSACANGAGVGALAIVDGSLPDDALLRIRSLPPLLTIWGTADRVFPVSIEAKLARLARRLGGTSESVTYEGRGHAFFVDPEDIDAARARTAIAAFFSARL